MDDWAMKRKEESAYYQTLNLRNSTKDTTSLFYYTSHLNLFKF